MNILNSLLIYMIIVLIILNMIKRLNSVEHMTTDEAIRNVASIYNNDNMKITKLSANNVEADNIKSKNLTTDNLTVISPNTKLTTNTIKTDNLEIGQLFKSFIKMPTYGNAGIYADIVDDTNHNMKFRLRGQDVLHINTGYSENPITRIKGTLLVNNNNILDLLPRCDWQGDKRVNGDAGCEDDVIMTCTNGFLRNIKKVC